MGIETTEGSAGRLMWLPVFIDPFFIFLICALNWQRGDTFQLTPPINWIVGLKKYNIHLEKFNDLFNQYWRHQSYLDMKKEYEGNN